MSVVKLSKWGNSLGIRIPAELIKEAHFFEGESLEIIADKSGKLTLIPAETPQAGWQAAFNKMADDEVDDLLMDFSNEFDEDGWTW
jgi:antitoxin MazE